jgi:hypothetical protein
LKGTEAAARLRAIADAVENLSEVAFRFQFEAAEGVEIPPAAMVAPSERPRSGAAARAKAYRDRERAKRDATTAPVTDARDGEHDGERDASRDEPLPTPLPFRSGSSGCEKENPNTTTTQIARAGVTPSRDERHASRPTRLHNLAEALTVPIAERARYVLANPHEAEWLEPQRWPQLLRLAEAHAETTGQKARLGRYGADAGVRVMVEHFAAGFELDDLEHVYRQAPRQAWYNAPGKRHGLSSITLEVVRRTLAGRREEEADAAKVQELVDLAARPRPPARAPASASPLSSLLAGVMPKPEEAADGTR